jgi:hypothetical protein
VDLRYGAATNSTGGFIHGKTTSAIPGYPDVSCFLFRDDSANELFLSAGLGSDCALIRRARLSWEETYSLFAIGFLVFAWQWLASATTTGKASKITYGEGSEILVFSSPVPPFARLKANRLIPNNR